MFDKFHEECGVVGIYGHDEAANLANLGIFTLQHRGQESAGVASADALDVYCYKAMGHVADIFTPSVINGLPGNKAIGHALGISPRTVEVHRAKVMEKLSCRTLADIIRFAAEAGLFRA